MMKTIIVVGVIIDIMMALFLLLVSGWIADSWDDPQGAWVGISATALWLGALALSAGAPIAGRVLNRRGAGPGRVALALWAPALLLVAVCVVGFLIFPL